MNLGTGRTIDGVRCWEVDRVPAGIAAFPTLSIGFAESGIHEFSPVHYMFNHPSVGRATHYCNGVDNNAPHGLVFGALFMRHFRTTIDRAGARVYMVPDSCGDTGALAAGAPPPPPPRVWTVQVQAQMPAPAPEEVSEEPAAASSAASQPGTAEPLPVSSSASDEREHTAGNNTTVGYVMAALVGS
eukprot:SAG22_NODE_9991_length_559_cov_1.454348_1_plen_185_part_11